MRRTTARFRARSSGACATAVISTSRARRTARRKSRQLLAEGTVQFAVTMPVDFSRKLLRGEKPDLLLEADATDPSAVGFAMAAVSQLATDGHQPRPDRAADEIARQCAAVQSGHAPALQPRKHQPIQHRARPHGRDADHDDDHHHRRWPSRANASAARWKTCSPRRRIRAKSSSAKSCPTSWSAMCRCR